MEELSLNIQLMKTFRRLGNLISTKATPFQGQGRILNLIRKEEKKQISQRELLEKTNMKSASLSEIVIKLENNNLITRTPNQEDKRNMILSLTQKGEEEAIRMREVSSQIADRAFSILNDEEKENLLSILSKLKDYWEVELWNIYT